MFYSKRLGKAKGGRVKTEVQMFYNKRLGKAKGGRVKTEVQMFYNKRLDKAKGGRVKLGCPGFGQAETDPPGVFTDANGIARNGDQGIRGSGIRLNAV